MNGEEANQDQNLYQQLEESVSNIKESLEMESLNTIAWMIADGLIEMIIAIGDKNSTLILL